MSIKTKITDDEILYRRIPSGRGLYSFRPDGSIEIEPTAFDDPECRPSVDRAALCDNDPWRTLNQLTTASGSDGGVVSLIARDVRSIEDINKNDSKGNALPAFVIDVEHVPLPDNDAHAEIYGNPAFVRADRKRVFRKLGHRLAILAEAREWEIVPRAL
jgi:hypothetical protein